MKKFLPSLIIAAALAVLPACVPLAEVREIKPRLAAPPGDSDELKRAEQAIAAAQKLEGRDPSAATGMYLDAVRESLARLHTRPRDPEALRDYNYALSRALATIGKYKIAAWGKPLELPAQGGGYLLSCRKDARKLWQAADYNFVPVDQLSVGGSAFKNEVSTQGLGAPLIAVRREPLVNYRDDFLGSKKVFYGVTAVARFEGRNCVIAFEDPLVVENVEVDGHRFPLAADYSAAMAMLLAQERPDRLGLVRLLMPERYASTARLARLQPYDSKKIPVLFVHGLQDTPATWALMINTLYADPELRRRYQFWVFSYPSGYPFPYSAALLRHDLDGIYRTYPGARRMVLIGHSMGGLISRLMVTDAGDKIWRAYFKKSPAETPLPARDKAFLSAALIFNHRPEVSRVIFISTPHHGSIIASNWIGRLVSNIIRTPGSFVAIAKDTMQLVVQDETSSFKINRIPNSIDTLSPKNRFLKAMNALPIAPGIPYHSIMGGGGKGDIGKSSDGVVAYWSSHLDGAASERAVVSGHSAHQSPGGIAEVARILKLNLKTQN